MIEQPQEQERRPQVGDIVTRPDGRRVKLLSGQLFDLEHGRLSNTWTWQEILPDGKPGKKESGYGWWR